MDCPRCGFSLNIQGEECPNCHGQRFLFRKKIVLVVLTSILFMLVIGNYVVDTSSTDQQFTTSNMAERSIYEIDSGSFEVPSFIVKRREEQAAEIEESIERAQETVYTITTEQEQGSGFLYNEDGLVITSSHVINGEEYISVEDKDGNFYEATLKGSSNFMDVAVLEVEELKGREPFPIEHDRVFDIGEEVVALGSPNGVKNTMTTGNITNTEHDLKIDQYEYEDLYEISASIEEGNSGGPLLSKKDQQFIAINAAKNIDNPSIGYSVPFYKIDDLIEELSMQN